MIWFKSLGVERALIYNGEVHIFDISGKETEVHNFLTPKYTTNAVKVGVISLLKSGGGELEIGIRTSQGFVRYTTTARHEEVLRCIMLQGQTMGFFNRVGTVSNIGFLQTILIYPEMIQLEQKIMQLGLSVSRL